MCGAKELDRTVRGFKNQRERAKIGQRQSPGCCWHWLSYICRSRGSMPSPGSGEGFQCPGCFSVPLSVSSLGCGCHTLWHHWDTWQEQGRGATPQHSHGGRCPAPIQGWSARGKQQKPGLTHEGLISSAITGWEISPKCSFNPWGKSWSCLKSTVCSSGLFDKGEMNVIISKLREMWCSPRLELFEPISVRACGTQTQSTDGEKLMMSLKNQESGL